MLKAARCRGGSLGNTISLNALAAAATAVARAGRAIHILLAAPSTVATAVNCTLATRRRLALSTASLLVASLSPRRDITRVVVLVTVRTDSDGSFR